MYTCCTQVQNRRPTSRQHSNRILIDAEHGGSTQGPLTRSMCESLKPDDGQIQFGMAAGSDLH